jgi:hypothetical protein
MWLQHNWLMSLEHMQSIRLLPNTPHHILTEHCSLKWNCVTWCRFSCIQECKFLLGNTTLGTLPSYVNRRSGRICRYGYSHSQICNKLEWSPGILWRWYKQKPSGCRILHTCVCSKSSWKFYAYWYFGLVAVLPEHHLIHTTVVHILHLLMERNHRILCMASNVLWCV